MTGHRFMVKRQYLIFKKKLRFISRSFLFLICVNMVAINFVLCYNPSSGYFKYRGGLFC